MTKLAAVEASSAAENATRSSPCGVYVLEGLIHEGAASATAKLKGGARSSTLPGAPSRLAFGSTFASAGLPCVFLRLASLLGFCSGS